MGNGCDFFCRIIVDRYLDANRIIRGRMAYGYPNLSMGAGLFCAVFAMDTVDALL